MSKVSAMQNRIKTIIARKMLVSVREIDIDQIIEELEKQGIINSGDSNSDTGMVKTQPDGYIFEIKKDEYDEWQVEYGGTGEITPSEVVISLSKSTSGITDEVTITMTAKASSGITSYTLPGGTAQSVASGTTEITKEYIAEANGTYEFTVVNGNGVTVKKSITIDNILDGIIQISADPTLPEYTSGNVVVTIVWPDDSSNAIKEIQIGEGSWQTVTGSTKQVILTQNNTVTARVRNSSKEITSATITVDNIDRIAPTAPTITGGGEAWATSRTIKVDQEATDEGSGVAYYEYYITNSSTAPTKATTATGRVGTTSASANLMKLRLGKLDSTMNSWDLVTEEKVSREK